MRMLLHALAGVVCLFAGADVALAATPGPLPPIGQVVATRLPLFGKQFPLPPGEWRVASTSFAAVAGADPGPYGTIGGVLLTREADKAEPQFILLRTNAAPVRGGWGPAPECASDKALFLSAAESRDLHAGCSFVFAARDGGLVAMVGDPSAADRLPPWALVAGFRTSDRNDVIDIRYGVVPRGPAASAWFGAPDSLGPRHRAALGQLAAWLQRARQIAHTAMRSPPDQVPPVPDLTLDGASASEGEDITALHLGLLKTATYRSAGSLFSWGVASALAGDLYVGAMVAGWQVVTHSAIYFANEMAWELPRAVPAMKFVDWRSSVTATADTTTPLPLPLANANGFTLHGKQVPLPSGSWTVLAEGPDAGVAGAVLARLEGTALLGLAVAHVNPEITKAIFGTAGDCGRSDIWFSVIRYDTPVDGYCSYAKAVASEDAAGDDSLWAVARARLAHSGISLPPVFLVVGARARTRESFVDVRYYFPPDDAMQLSGVAGAIKVAASPGLQEEAVALQAWADLLQQKLEFGLRGRLPSAEAELPWPERRSEVQAALLRQAHAPLEAMRDAGAIDDAELQRQLDVADAALAARERQRWSLWVRSAYKIATYRALSFVDAVAVSWVVTASPEQSFAYAGINAVVQPVMAYVNEIGWAGSGVGRPSAALRVVDFAEIGADQP
jgi:uncharacterized membrane protein